MKLFLAVALSCLVPNITQAKPSNSELSDWFSKSSNQRGAIPPASLDLPIKSTSAVKKAKSLVWSAYKKAALQQQWDKAIPASQKTVKSWKKNGQIAPKVAEVGEKKMPYVVLTNGRKPAGGWPLFICLHGGGGNPRATGPHTWPVNDREWHAQMTLTTKLWKAPGLYVIPRMADDREGRWYYGYNQIFIDRIIQQAILFNEVDSNKVHLMGISEGGYTAFRLGSMMADRWASSCAMAAAEPIGNAPPENLRHVAFRCGIGEHDTMFNRHILARDYFKRLAELSKQHPGQYINHHDEQKGRGHGIDYKDGPAWIAKHTRTAVPKNLTWTVVKQHDRHRNRLYWLALEDYQGNLPLKLTADVLPNNKIKVTAKINVDGEDVDATGFTCRVYLDQSLVDLSKPVTITANGKEAFSGVVKPSMEAIIRSTAERGDPRQVFPVQVKLKL